MLKEVHWILGLMTLRKETEVFMFILASAPVMLKNTVVLLT